MGRRKGGAGETIVWENGEERDILVHLPQIFRPVLDALGDVSGVDEIEVVGVVGPVQLQIVNFEADIRHYPSGHPCVSASALPWDPAIAGILQGSL